MERYKGGIAAHPHTQCQLIKHLSRRARHQYSEHPSEAVEEKLHNVHSTDPRACGKADNFPCLINGNPISIDLWKWEGRLSLFDECNCSWQICGVQRPEGAAQNMKINCRTMNRSHFLIAVIKGFVIGMMKMKLKTKANVNLPKKKLTIFCKLEHFDLLRFSMKKLKL